ncbi:flagella basal body P-ring formation protein FlgA [Blastopirellula marina]|uniref:Flagella basal body P-ring formation protein FlgA n=1 Tax=Blastopirellula marina TaxID=124 RepID=A0A2S8FEV6_9BACT|nr:MULTISPECIES: flagellar basal body P-ring formation chaperone FlgA [Pirellulaceae]PQO30711.1 flagella basal body P-ring formation protein FlgA [Blastopirellula marina]RCS50848.1 flagella basal body P-ring formation protein FlgA [Bremerella cremea]
MTIATEIRSLFSILVLLAVSATAMAQADQVVLKTSAVVGGPLVRLGDVAAIEVQDRELRGELTEMELMPAPGTDHSTYLTINDIRSILAARGVSSEQVAVTGSNRVRMEAASVEDTIEHAAVSAKRVPHRTFGGKVDPPQEIMTVAHVVRNVRRGEVIQASDVEMRELTVIRRDDSYPSAMHNVVGKEATRTIAADRPVSSEDIREPIIVRRNDVVTVYAHAGNVIVRREMLALNDAGIRELVEVQPIEPTHFGRARQVERFQAQVTGPGEAIVLGGHVKVPTSKPLMPLPQPEIKR